VRLLVTSQAKSDESWELWNLPDDISELREQLLVRWLGDENGKALSRRLVAEHLSDFIISGYDLRLIADLASADPDHTPLPSDRISLYRAILARPLRLAPQPAMRRADEEREPVPIAGDAEWPLPDARRTFAGRAEG
jgi:hypothetical protein